MECTGLDGSHEYSEKTCPACGEEFCFSCCGNTNVHEGGKYEEDFMNCPKCGFNYYAEPIYKVRENGIETIFDNVHDAEQDRDKNGGTIIIVENGEEAGHY